MGHRDIAQVADTALSTNLRRISDHGYITAPDTGYGGRILDLNPGVLTGGGGAFSITV